MTEMFNLESFRLKAQSVLECKELVPINEYILQLEDLLHELQPGNTPKYSPPGIDELKGYLEKARARINSLFYNAPVAYCVLDAIGKIVITNKAFRRLFSIDQAALDGEYLRKYIHPESVELLDFQINKIITTKTTLSTNLKFYKGDKEIFIRFQTTYYNEEGKDFLQCIATDVSDTKAIENELAASEAQFHNLLEASPLGVLVLYKGKCIYSNTAGASLFKYNHPDELYGITAIDTIAEESKPMITERLKRLEKNLSNDPVETVIQCKDGQLKTCETASIPVIFNNRLSALVLISDISERKNNEKLIKESEKKYKEMYQLLRLMCDNVPDMIWAKDLDDQYIFTNKAVSANFLNAVDTNEPIGRTDAFFTQRERERHPENDEWHTFEEICRDEDKTVITSKTTQHFNTQGNALGKFLNLDILKAPFFDSDGNIIGTVGSGRNVSHERWLQSENDKMFESLTIQSARLNGVMNVLPDLLFIINTDGDFLDFFATDPSLLALEPGLIKELNVKNLFSPEEAKRQLEIYTNCIKNQSISSFEYDLFINEETKYYEARIAPFSSNSVLAIIRDITEKKENEEKLKKYTGELIAAKEKAEESDRLKSAFLANMSHEIRTPMNSIMGFADLLNEPDMDENKRQQFTDIIIGRSADLLKIINDILDISRIESGNTSICTTNCDLNKMLDELNRDFASKLELGSKPGLRLSCEKAIHLGSFVFETDELKLKQIFVNLLDNALKFTRQGTIRFGYTMPENGTITCFVSDTGIGVDPKYHGIIFERFRQAEIPNRNEYKGTGLGLAICKGNTEIMGGTMWVESEPGKGSEFFFRLPFLQHLEDGSINTNHKIISGFFWKNKNIVIVEDDEQNVKYFQAILRRTGANVFHASNSVTFREMLSLMPDIHLILMDIQLPGEDGWQLTQYVKSIRSDIPIVAQTALGMESDRLKSIEAGCDNYIAKPISPDDLLKVVALYLEKQEVI